MKSSPSLAVALAVLLAPLAAQSTAALKKELRAKEAAAKKDPEALFEAGRWAQQQSLNADASRLFKAVLKIAPDHEGANEALGNERIDGKWVPAKEAAEQRRKAAAAEFAAKGFVEVDGVWVEPDHVADAKRGVFRHDGEIVTREEKVALTSGSVRHPKTGQIIAGKDLEKAQSGYFPIGEDGRWVDEAEADRYHGDMGRPWVVRTNHGTLISTLPLAKIQELQLQLDQGCERVRPLLGNTTLPASRRPVVIVARTRAEFSEYGQAFGDGTDAAGAFLMEDKALVTVPFQGQLRAAICENEKDWGPRYVRHAAALSLAHNTAQEAGVELPLWFLHGVGSYTSRFENDWDAGWFGKQHVQKGGVSNVKAFFAGFTISGDMESTAIAYNLYQAGLMLSFATRASHPGCSAAMKEVTAVLSGGAKPNAAKKAFEALETQLAGAQDAIVAHLQELIAKGPQ